MFKIGEKVYHFQQMNKIGLLKEILTYKNNQLTVGGTTEARVFGVIEYRDGTTETYPIGDIQKSFD